MQISKDFNWFIGIVEDRNDPKSMGRLKVRVFGDHTEDKTKIPTEDLPWAQVMMPVTSASLGGVGASPTGIVQGSWVVGFWMDGTSKQVPFVLGTIHGEAGPSGKSQKGFSDPESKNPQRVTGIDTPNASNANFKRTEAFIQRSDLRVSEIDTAVPDKVTSVVEDEDDSYYERVSWEMPHIMNNNETTYPYNKVNQTEGGHQFEIDDTPGNERISEFHKSGTSREILPDGTIATTIKGKNYTAVLSDDNVYIRGNVNMTVDGNYRHLVKGNYHLEVVGNKTELIRGTRQTSIAKSEHIEVGQDFASNITEKYLQRIGGDETRIVDGGRDTTIGKTEDIVSNEAMSIVCLNKLNMFASTQGFEIATTGHLKAAASLDVTFESKANLNTTIEGNTLNNVGGNWTDNVDGNIDMNATRIDLN